MKVVLLTHIGDNMALMYNKERHVQLLISLLKAKGIRKVIASPGTTNMSFVGSIQNDSFFQVFSSVDERSAAYMACGLAAESGEPVIISCTGATASRNYFPALTEAFYRKLPILAITSHQGNDNLYNLEPQQIDRRISPNDIFVEKVELLPIENGRTENLDIIEANKALLALTRNGGGPVHINLITREYSDYSDTELPLVREIKRFTVYDRLPDVPNGKIAIVIGSHRLFSKEETKNIETFCESNNAVVFCDHTSNYKGKYSINFGLVCCQENYRSPLREIDLLVHLGEVSGDYYGMRLFPKKVWRVNLDGELRDLYHRLEAVFEMPINSFFSYYSNELKTNCDFYKECVKEKEYLSSLITELPFSNIWIAKELSHHLPQNAVLHLGILNSLRAWDFADIDNSIMCYSNVGGFGIDGALSTLIGASLNDKSKLFFGVVGDLAFFYDLNSLGNRHLSNNVRILLINNGKGTEFTNHGHPAHHIFGDDANPFIAASGHFGGKSNKLVRDFAENLGFCYLSASNKKEFQEKQSIFLSHSVEKSIIYEVFTNSEEESEALKILFNLIKTEEEQQMSFIQKVKTSMVFHYNNALEKLKYQ